MSVHENYIIQGTRDLDVPSEAALRLKLNALTIKDLVVSRGSERRRSRHRATKGVSAQDKEAEELALEKASYVDELVVSELTKLRAKPVSPNIPAYCNDLNPELTYNDDTQLFESKVAKTNHNFLSLHNTAVQFMSLGRPFRITFPVKTASLRLGARAHTLPKGVEVGLDYGEEFWKTWLRVPRRASGVELATMQPKEKKQKKKKKAQKKAQPTAQASTVPPLPAPPSKDVAAKVVPVVIAEHLDVAAKVVPVVVAQQLDLQYNSDSDHEVVQGGMADAAAVVATLAAKERRGAREQVWANLLVRTRRACSSWWPPWGKIPHPRARPALARSARPSALTRVLMSDDCEVHNFTLCPSFYVKSWWPM